MSARIRAIKGYMLTCDVPMREYIIHLDKSMHFIIRLLSDGRIFINPGDDDVNLKRLQEKLDEWQDKNSFVSIEDSNQPGGNDLPLDLDEEDED